MKRLKITSVLLSATMCLSMITTPVGVWADETPSSSETQTSETTKTEETKKTEKNEPSETEPESTEPTEETPEETETQPTEPSKTEYPMPAETVPAKNDTTGPGVTPPPEPDETRPSEPSNPENEDQPGNGGENNPGNGNGSNPEENIDYFASGTCGQNLTWYIARDRMDTLHIEGYGDMYDYSSTNSVPWAGYSGMILYIYISNNVTSIGNYAFYGTNIQAVYASSTNLKRIGNFAFSKCWGNKNMELPQGLTTIGVSAFEDSQFETVYIPSSVTTIGECAFNECFNLKEITIPGSVKTIPANLFRQCFRLEKVTFLDGVTTINSVFANCSTLKTVTIPKSVTTINSKLFSDTPLLSDIYYGGTQTEWEQSSFELGYNTGNKPTMHFSSYAAVGKYENLTWSLDNNGVLTITGSGEMADSVNGPNWRAAKDSIKSVVFSGNISSIASGAFEGCSNLSSITVPNSVAKIGSIAFLGCTGLKSVTMSDSVTSIDDSCFSGCSALTSITLSKKLTTIGPQIFQGCYSLTNIVISDGITEIGDNAFEYCINLKSITIPKSVTKIGSFILLGCVAANDIYYNGTKDDWNKISINTDNEEFFKATVHLSDGTVIEGNKADNTLKVTGGKTAKIKYRKLRKKARTISRSKVMSVSAPQGTVTYKLVSVKKSKYKKYFKINATTGTITVKKKLKRGTYTVRCSVTASGDANYKSKTQTVTFKIKVK